MSGFRKKHAEEPLESFIYDLTYKSTAQRLEQAKAAILSDNGHRGDDRCLPTLKVQ